MTTRTVELPLRRIICARQDEDLVKLMLRRHTEGHLNWKDIWLDSVCRETTIDAFPGRSYGTVRVCHACNCVYALIERARNFKITQREGMAGMVAKKEFNPEGVLFHGTVHENDHSLPHEKYAIERLTLLDIAELRSYVAPPPAVALVATALLVLLTGGIVLKWKDARRAMSNGEKFLQIGSVLFLCVLCCKNAQCRRALVRFNCDSITPNVERAIEPFVENKLFHPEIIARASVSASRACMWILSALESRSTHMGERGHERSSYTKHPKASKTNEYTLGHAKKTKKPSASMMTHAPRCAGESYAVRWVLPYKRSCVPIPDTDKLAASTSKQVGPALNPFLLRSSRLFFSRTLDILPVEMQVISPNKSLLTIRCVWPRHTSSRSVSKGERAARLVTQRRQMQRLSSRPQDQLMTNHELVERGRRLFVCSDGSTTMPYEIIGAESLELTSYSLVIVHDMFDTLDSTKIFLHSIVKRNPGCRILVYNYAGQAGTVFPTNPKHGISVETHAQSLNELLHHVNSCGEMMLSTYPFFLVGIGFGLSICVQYATNKYAVGHGPRFALKGLISVNGVPHIDTPYAAILHGALDAFKNLPTDRPDLPVSYLSRFQFSDAYLSRVHPHLALNIYTAVANPITLCGRLALIRGALNSSTAVGSISDIPLPIVALQSTEDVFVVPSSIETLLRGRVVHHIWSHQMEQQNSERAIGPRAQLLIHDGIANTRRPKPYFGCAIWVRSGHEVRQEAPCVLISLFDALVPYQPATTEDKVYPPQNSKPPSSKLNLQNGVGSRGHSYDSQAQDSIATDEKIFQAPNGPTCETQQDSVSEGEFTIAPAGETPIINISADSPEASVTYFTIKLAQISPHELTRNYHLSLLQEVTSRLSEMMEIAVKEFRVELKAKYAGSLILNVETERILDTGSVNVFGVELISHASFLSTAWGQHTLLVTRGTYHDDNCSEKINRSTSFFPQRYTSKRTPVASHAQRQSKLYADSVNSPKEAIYSNLLLISVNDDLTSFHSNDEGPQENSTRLHSQEYIEMQRQVNVDVAEAKLAREGFIPPYKPPPGQGEPILHPPPVAYSHSDLPIEIVERNSTTPIFSSSGTGQELKGTKQNMTPDRGIKAEFYSSQLLYEILLQNH